MTEEVQDDFDYSQPHHIVVDCSTGTVTPTLLTDDELSVIAAREAAWEAAAPERLRDDLRRQIDAIEQTSNLPRAIRDLTLLNPSAPNYARAQDIETEIAALRSQIDAIV